MLNFYFKTKSFGIFLVSFDVEPCFIVSSYKILVSFSDWLDWIKMFLQKYLKNI